MDFQAIVGTRIQYKLLNLLQFQMQERILLRLRMLMVVQKHKTFTVVNSEMATITNIDVTDFNEDLIATISVTGNGNYEYSLDGINFQSSPIFNLSQMLENIPFMSMIKTIVAVVSRIILCVELSEVFHTKWR